MQKATINISTDGIKINRLPPIEVLKSLFCYDPISGALSHNPAAPKRKGRDLSKVGCIGKDGYIRLSINYTTAAAHRVCWAIYYGTVEFQRIDHINSNRADNRISNLREVTASQNLWNSKIKKQSSTGIKGLSFTNGYWQGCIRGQNRKFTTTRNNKEAVIQWLDQMRAALHGEFASK